MTTLKVSIRFDSGARIGPGKAALLESIHETGSISAAARSMGMTYKRAWMLLDSINQTFDQSVVKTTPGGSGGGGALLTTFGADVLARYRRIAKKAANGSAADLAALSAHAKRSAGPKV